MSGKSRYQKKQEEDHRRCSCAALDDQQFTTARGNAEYDDWQNKIKEKNAVKLPPCDKVNKAESVNHGGPELIDLSEKKGDASSSKKGCPVSHAAKWHQTDSNKKVKAEKDAPKTIVVVGGLPLTLIKKEDSPPLPEEDDRSTKGFELTKNAKDVKKEPIEPAPYEQSPIRDKMSADAQISLITDTVNFNAEKDDPESQAFMQKMLELVHDLEASKISFSQPSGSSGTEFAKEENSPADEVMPDAPADEVMPDVTSPKIDDPNKVDLSGSDNDIDGDK